MQRNNRPKVSEGAPGRPAFGGMIIAAVTLWVLLAPFRADAQIPGGTLDPADVPKYATPLLIPPVMPKAGILKQTGEKTLTITRSR